MNKKTVKHRLAEDKLMLWSVCLLAALTAVPLFAILGEVVWRGYGQLSWSFFTEPTPTAYKAMKAIEAGEPIPGGIANGIVGSMIMLDGGGHSVRHPLRGVFGGARQKPFCPIGKLSDRSFARHAIGHYRYHHLHLGGRTHEGIFGYCR